MIVFVLRLQSVTERKKRENGRKRRAQVVGFNTLNNFCAVCFFFLFRLVCWENVFSVIKLCWLCCSLSLSRERERERKEESLLKRQFLFVAVVLFICSFLFRQSIKRESMKASSSKSRETDDASPLSEQQKQRTGELRFRFRSSALKQSPSSDALLHDGEEEDFLEEDQLARYVEPPELPTLAMHKVFGTFLLEAFSYMRNV